MSDNLIDQLRKEAARNAQMQGDKEQQTNRRRKTFRYRNHILTAAADRIEKLDVRWESARAYIRELEAQIVAGTSCQRYTAESFMPKTQFVQFTTQPDGELMLTADVLEALAQ